MSTSNGFTEINGIFDSVTDLQKYSGKSISTVAVNNGTVLDWYQVSTIDNGSAVALDSGLFANPVAPSVAGFGTAAYADLTTSSTDATANRVTKVGDFGLGGEVIACPNTDLNDVVVTGFYDISGATLNKPPALSPTNAVCMTIVRTSDNMVQMVYNRRSHQIFQRYKNNTWSSWTEVLTDSNFGKAEIDALNIDADTVDGLNSTQFLRSDVAGTINGELTIGGSSVSGGEGGQIAFTKAPLSTHTNDPVFDSNGDVLRYISSAGGIIRSLTLPAETGTVLHTGSLAFLQNQSGGTLGSTATVAGSSLFPTQVGTWRNVSGGDILNNGWGLWGIV